MVIDSRELTEYAFDGVFYAYGIDTSKPLLEQETEEIEILRTKCDIQQTSQIGNAGFLASSYTIFFPLKENPAFSDTDDDGGITEATFLGLLDHPDDEEDEDVKPEEPKDQYPEQPENKDDETEETSETDNSVIDGKTWEDVVILRGMYFMGSIYGYEVNGKVIGVAPSMLGGCSCQIKDLDEKTSD